MRWKNKRTRLWAEHLGMKSSKRLRLASCMWCSGVFVARGWRESTKKPDRISRTGAIEVDSWVARSVNVVRDSTVTSIEVRREGVLWNAASIHNLVFTDRRSGERLFCRKCEVIADVVD